MTQPATRNLSAVLAATATAVLLFGAGISGGAYDVVDRQTIAVLLWWAVGLTALVSPRIPAFPRAAGIAAIAFAAGIAVWIALNITRSISEERTVVELGRAVTHLAPLVLIGWLMPARLWRAVIVGATIGAVAICIAALGNRLSPGFLGQSNAVVFTGMVSRLSAPLGYWNAVGSWSVITTALLLATSAHAPRGWLRALAAAPIPLTVTVAYLTYSRSSIGAAVLAILVLVALSQHRWTTSAHVALAGIAGAVAVSTVRGLPEIANASGSDGGGHLVLVVILCGLALAGAVVGIQAVGVDRIALPMRTARIVVAITGTAVVLAGVVVVAQRGGEAWDKFTTTSKSTNVDPSKRLATLSNGYRVAQWRIALDDWKTHKLAGSGAGTFELTYNLHADDNQFVRDAHSAYLEALTEQGVIGLALLVGFTLAVLFAVVQAAVHVRGAPERGLIAGAGAGIVAFLFGSSFDWFWEVTALALLFLVLAGAVIAATRADAPLTARRPLRIAARAAVVLGALLAVLVELPGLVGTSEIRRSQHDVQRQDYTAARAHADQAIDILPWASSPFLQRALVDERDGQLASARRAAQLAIARDPLDWRIPLVLARIEAKAGDADAAIAAYRRAKHLRPHGQFFAGQ